MAKCLILRGFAYGSSKKPKQYNKGKTMPVTGEALEFAKSNGLVDVLEADAQDRKECQE